MTHTANHLCLYLEDAPVIASCAATGLSKALVPMLLELAPYTLKSLVVQTHRYLDPSQIIATGAVSSRISSRWHYLVAKACARLPLRLGALGAALHGTWLGWGVRGTDGLNPARTKMWGAIGVDPLTLVRLQACARAAGLRYEAYLVDDIEAHPSNAGKSGLH
ncbi:hypothetical protein ACVBEH_00955, partial [Roseateles sp. GG27B]